jgi:hypothetical protein
MYQRPALIVSKKGFAGRSDSPLFELALVLVRLNHVVSFIENAHHCMM